MTDLAPVDRLRRLPHPVMLRALVQLEAELGPEAVAALQYELDAAGRPSGFWARRSQLEVLQMRRWSTLVITGDYGSGKTWTATQLFLSEILSGRARLPRVICATGAAIDGTLVNGPSGLLRWLPPDVPRAWFPSKGHAGELTIAGVKVKCISADSPGQAIGEGSDLDFRDDVAKWTITAGAAGAQDAWVAAVKSCREGDGRAIVPTTPDGVGFIQLLLHGNLEGVTRVDLGGVETNRGNLAASFLVNAQHLREQGLWLQRGGESPFADFDFASAYEDHWPRFVELGIAIDTADTNTGRSCEVGIVGGGRDVRDVVHLTDDASCVLSADEWPAVAWDLAERLQREHPGAPLHFVVETNRGRSSPAALLRGEEKLRLTRRGLPAIPMAEVREVRAATNKCERAVSPRRIAGMGFVRFARGLTKLEGQLRSLTTHGTNSDAADAGVHLMNDLARLDERNVKNNAEEHAQRAAADEGVKAVARMAERLATRGAPPEPGPMKVPGAPPGDARYAGPRTPVFSPSNYRTRRPF
jgi:hypothetical protein